MPVISSQKFHHWYSDQKQFFARRPIVWSLPLVASLLHLLFAHLTTGIRGEYFFAHAALLLPAYLGANGRRYTVLMFPLWLTGVSYDNFRFVEPFRGAIHVDDIYHAELAWFGIHYGGDLLTPSHFLTHFRNSFFDVICGIAYIVYMFTVFIYGVYLLRRQRHTELFQLAWGFYLVNLLGLLTYLLFPAAPPWYVDLYGLGPADLTVPPDPAGTIFFDQITGIHYFEAFYSRNANVFGAMPSLHVAYPMFVFMFARRSGKAWGISMFLFTLLVAFSAVYFRHHYVWDAVVGALYGIIGGLIASTWIKMPKSLDLTAVSPNSVG